MQISKNFYFLSQIENPVFLKVRIDVAKTKTISLCNLSPKATNGKIIKFYGFKSIFKPLLHFKFKEFQRISYILNQQYNMDSYEYHLTCLSLNY